MLFACGLAFPKRSVTAVLYVHHYSLNDIKYAHERLVQ